MSVGERLLSVVARDANGLVVPIRQQDGSIVELHWQDTLENLWTAQYIAQHEAYADAATGAV